MREYREKVDSVGYTASDRKKVLALPFYLAKRQQLPEPRYGQHEFELFKELTGRNWYDDARLLIDEEHKITEFDYENYLDAKLLPKDASKDPEFKKLIKVLNFFSKTEYEALQEAKESFKELMPLLRHLTKEEQQAFVHKVKNSNRKHGDETTNSLLTDMTFNLMEEKLAKVSEEENF